MRRDRMRGGNLKRTILLFLCLPVFASALPAKLDGVALVPGVPVGFDASLSTQEQALVLVGGNSRVSLARCVVAIPNGFDPGRAWPILVVNTPIGSRAVDALPAFAPSATDAGWVIVAADGALPAKLETTEWCYAMLAAALDHLERSWPGVKRWPLAAAGHSGGAKRAPYIAAALMERGATLMGLYLSGCNEDRATDALRWHRPGLGFMKVPIFLSSGARDAIATPADHERVAAEMAKRGFTTIRCERHDDGHVLNTPHLSLALRWFRETRHADGGH